MPTGARHTCGRPGCPNLASYGQPRCDTCTKARATAYEQGRADVSAWYQAPRWRRYRRVYLAQHPFCVTCRVNASSVVDHKTPWRRGRDEAERYAFFWDEGNHQALCASCHSTKTAREDGGFGNPKGAGA